MLVLTIILAYRFIYTVVLISYQKDSKTGTPKKTPPSSGKGSAKKPASPKGGRGTPAKSPGPKGSGKATPQKGTGCLH